MPYGKPYKSKISFMTNKPVVKSPRQKVIAKKRSRPSLVQRVQRIISSNVENKYTDSRTFIAPIGTLIAGTPNFFQYYLWAPGSNSLGSQLFDLKQGVNQQERIGNTIKLKRWVIKGLIQPNVNIYSDRPAVLQNTMIGYVEVFFGRLLNNSSGITNLLEDLYQAGSAAITPNMTAGTILYPLNKDKYKIYWRKRFKMGQAQNAATFPQTSNNDFSLTRTFGFDVTKYILKNKHIKYEDADTTPNDDMIENLTVFAVFYPAIGNVGINDLTYPETGYTLNCQTYAEYEDA